MARLATVAAWLLAPAMLAAMIAVSGPANLMGDFRAFYCAGDAIAHGANPYLEEPLHACEQRAHPPAVPRALRFVTLPAPLPPPALAAFVPLARLPFPLAGAVYEVLLVAAMSAAVLLFARAAGVSSVLLNLSFAGVTATQTYFLGQPVPFVFLAVGAAALLVRRGQWIAAAACAAATIGEPAIAVPVVLAMLVLLPRTRLPLAAFGLLLALAGVGAVGWATSLAYVRDVVPAHAIANAYEWQFSLTSILTSAGMGARAAVRDGELMYAVMTIVGVAVAARIRRANGDRAALVLVPPAFAVFGGVHVHYQQLIIAFPAIFYVYARYPQVRNLAATGLTFAMIPWNLLSGSVLTGFTPFVVGWFAHATMGARRGLILTSVAAVIALSVLVLALAGFGPGNDHFVPHAYSPNALAEESWGNFSRAVLARPSPLIQWLRVPIIAGLALALIAVTQAAFRPAPAVRSAPAGYGTRAEERLGTS
jgi:hypothetical protein